MEFSRIRLLANKIILSALDNYLVNQDKHVEYPLNMNIRAYLGIFPKTVEITTRVTKQNWNKVPEPKSNELTKLQTESHLDRERT